MEVILKTKVGAMGRIVIPYIIRKRLNLSSGSSIDMCIEDDKFIIKSSQQHIEDNNGICEETGKGA